MTKDMNRLFTEKGIQMAIKNMKIPTSLLIKEKQI